MLRRKRIVTACAELLFAVTGHAQDTSIRPFMVNVPEEAFVDLRRRLAATRWPSRETVADQSQGMQLAKLEELVRHWGTNYDWRKTEARLNAFPQFVTTIDGVDIHFIHVRSRHPNALPVIMTHGWPGSILELLKTVEPLTDPTAHGGRGEDAFDLVIPSIPGFGFSGSPARRSPAARPERHRTRGCPDDRRARAGNDGPEAHASGRRDHLCPRRHVGIHGGGQAAGDPQGRRRPVQFLPERSTRRGTSAPAKERSSPRITSKKASRSSCSLSDQRTDSLLIQIRHSNERRISTNRSRRSTQGVQSSPTLLRTQTTDERQGFMKTLVGDDDRIYGFTMIGLEGGEVVAVLQTAMLAGLPYTGLCDAILAHPTMVEGLGSLFSNVPPRSGQ